MYNRRGQSILEYSLILACVIAALVGMRIYVKRGISGGLRSAADQIGKQYDPLETISDTHNYASSGSESVVKTYNVDTDDDSKIDSTVSITYNVIGPNEVIGWEWDPDIDDIKPKDGVWNFNTEGTSKAITAISADQSRLPEITGTLTDEKIPRK